MATVLNRQPVDYSHLLDIDQKLSTYSQIFPACDFTNQHCGSSLKNSDEYALENSYFWSKGDEDDTGDSMEDSDQSSSSSSSARTTIELQNHGRRRKVFIIPRIVKHDVRRQYATMIANVYNSQDKEYLKEFLNVYFRPDAIYYQSNRRFNHPHRVKFCLIDDLQTLEDFWYQHMHDTPDLVYRLGKIQFKLKSDNTGTVTFQCSITGTQCSILEKIRKMNEMALFRQHNLREIQVDNYVPDVIDPFGTSLTELDSNLVPNSFISQRRLNNDHLKLRDNPIIDSTPFIFQGLFVLHFDEDSRIFMTKVHVVDFSPR